MRAISVQELYNTRRNLLELSPEYEAHLGVPELKGSWIIWGNSANGKTDYALQLAKELSKYERVAYNSLEEGNSQSLALACKRNNMHECKSRFIITQDNYEGLIKRLKRHKSPNVIITDSFQYMGINYNQYKTLLAKFPKKLFIWISHAEGKLPEGRSAKKVRYDAFIKIYVEGFVAQATGRYGGGEPFTIWEEGANRFNLDV